MSIALYFHYKLLWRSWLHLFAELPAGTRVLLLGFSYSYLFSRLNQTLYLFSQGECPSPNYPGGLPWPFPPKIGIFCTKGSTYYPEMVWRVLTNGEGIIIFISLIQPQTLPVSLLSGHIFSSLPESCSPAFQPPACPPTPTGVSPFMWPGFCIWLELSVNPLFQSVKIPLKVILNHPLLPYFGVCKLDDCPPHHFS